MINQNLLNSVLCCINPRMHITPTHYVCGRNFALFNNFAQIENCLTGLTNHCKGFVNTCKTPKLRDDTKK